MLSGHHRERAEERRGLEHEDERSELDRFRPSSKDDQRASWFAGNFLPRGSTPCSWPLPRVLALASPNEPHDEAAQHERQADEEEDADCEAGERGVPLSPQPQ